MRPRLCCALLAAGGVLSGLMSPTLATAAPAAASTASAPAVIEARDTFHALPPVRLLDTRSGVGAPKAAVTGGSEVKLQVAGRGSVPAGGVSAVVLNVTSTSASGPAYVTVWPTGAPRPEASSLNARRGTIVPNLVKVKVGTDGKVSLFVSAGSMHLIADVSGWFGADEFAGGLYTPLAPARVLDTRDGTGQEGAGAVVGGSSITVALLGRGGIPGEGVSAIVLNVTATAPTAPGFVTVWPSGTRPLASNLNLTTGRTVPNRVIVKVGADGAVRLFSSATTHLIADVGGWYGTTPSGSVGASFEPISPVRIVDTRTGLGSSPGPLAGGDVLGVQVAGKAGVPQADSLKPATAVVANITVTGATAQGYVTAWPNGTDRPGTSDLNVRQGDTVANLAIVKLGPDGRINVFANAGTQHVLVDVLGWYAGDVVITPEAEILSDAEAGALTEPVEPTDTSLTFTALPAGVVVGDVLVAGVTPKTPYGLLKKATAINPGAGGVVVDVEPAALTDVLEEGRLAAVAPLDSTTLTPVPSATRARSSARTATAQRAAGSITLENSISFGISKKIPSEGPASVTIEGSASIAASATLDVEIDCCFDVTAKAELELTSAIELKVTGSLEAEIESNPIPMFRGVFAPLTLPIGPVPVVVLPAMDVDLVVSGKVSYGVSGKITRSGSVKTGIRYDEENGFDPYFDIEGEPGAFEGPEGELAAEVKAALKPTGKLLVYGVAGPGFSPSVYAKIVVTPCSAKLGLGLALEAKFELSVLGHDLGEFSATLSDDFAVLAETTLGVCGGLRVTPHEKKVVKGATVPYVAEVDSEDDPPPPLPPLFWTADGGTISPEGVWTAPQTFGTYTITATSQLDSRVTGETTVEVVEPGPIWKGTITFRWEYLHDPDWGWSKETQFVTYTLRGEKENVGNLYLYEEDVDWVGEATWVKSDDWCGGVVETASGSSSSTADGNHKEGVQIGTMGDGSNSLYVGTADFEVDGTNNNCRGLYGGAYDITHTVLLGSHFGETHIGPPDATTVSGSRHWVGEAPYQEGMQTWVTWQLTKEPDCDFDGLPDAGDPC